MPDDFKRTFKEHLKTVDCDNHDICLADSMFIDFTCDDTTCTEITVDTNGKKNPNQPGMDKYKFDITEEGIFPQGEQESCIGYDCGKFVLTYHKLFEGLTPYCVAYSNGECTTCDDGYYQEGGKCSAVDLPNCDIYTGENCTRCESNYLLQAGECITMESQNYVDTDDGSTCSTCKDHYSNNNGVCMYITIDDCIAYSKDKCSVCDSGFLQKNGACLSLSSQNCLASEDGLVCSSCTNKYHNNNGVCEEVNIAHYKNDGYSQDKCQTCETGYTSTQTACLNFNECKSGR